MTHTQILIATLAVGLGLCLGFLFQQPDPAIHCQQQHTLNNDACYLELTK